MVNNDLKTRYIEMCACWMNVTELNRNKRVFHINLFAVFISPASVPVTQC